MGLEYTFTVTVACMADYFACLCSSKISARVLGVISNSRHWLLPTTRVGFQVREIMLFGFSNKQHYRSESDMSCGSQPVS